jgi:hypothetical protein
MHLPHIDEAYVPEPKISDYLLADDHPSGRSKALFFDNLGFRKDQPAALRLALLQHAAGNEVSSVQQTSFGAKYLIDGRIFGPTGAAAAIRSVWFIEVGQRGPRLITAYPLRGEQK